MPSWFSRVFDNKEKAHADRKPTSPSDRPSAALTGAAPASEEITRPNPILDSEEYAQEVEERRRKPRKVINPPLRVSEADKSAWSDRIRIRARIDASGRECTLMVDRPVLEGYSAIFNAPEDAAESPLARKLFSVEGVGAVTIHDFTITLGRSPVTTRDWEPLAFEAGEAVREHLKAERPVVTETFIASIPPEEDIRKRLDLIIQNEINPGIASHGGAIQLHRVRGNTVYIEMMGGCQGCAASTVTLKQGIYQAFRSAVPQIGAILDVTDHSAGSNPYFDALPPEMQAYA